MFLFLVGGLLKDPGNLTISLFPGLAGKIGVPVPGLGLTGKGGEDVFLCLRTFDTHGVFSFSL